MATGSKKRRWVVKAIVGFVAILAVLTFFSNTIMNATIPKVDAKKVSRGNLAFTNSDTAMTKPTKVTKVTTPKGLETRVVDEVMVLQYEDVTKGQVLFTLKDAEESEELEALEDQLEEKIRNRNYEDMSPSADHDYSGLQDSIDLAEANLKEAESRLTKVQNADATADEAKAIIAENSPLVNQYQSESDSISTTIEEINRDIDSLNQQLERVNDNINDLEAMGTPTPIPTPIPGSAEYSVVREKVILNDVTGDPAGGEEPTPEITPTTDPTPEVTPTTEPTPEVTPTAEPTPEVTPTANPTPEVTPTAVPTPEVTPTEEPTPTPEPTGNPSLIPGTMEYYVNKRGELEEEIRNLQSQLESAEGRLATASSNLAEAQGKIDDAQTVLAELEALPTLEEAQRAVNSANTALSQARKSLSNQQQSDNVQDLRDSDSRKDLDEDIEELQEKIDTIKENAEIIEIKAPADGFAYNITVRSGDALQEKAELLQIVDNATDYTVEFKFSSDVARTMQVGSELEVNEYYVDKCVIKKIVPDSENPREQMSVICEIDGGLYPEMSITAVAGKSNKDYEMVVPASAVYEDNSGLFVYVVDESSTPLGEKLVVRKVSVTEEESDGSRTAIKGDGIDKDALIVVRSDKPLNNGDRVRREDYSDKE